LAGRIDAVRGRLRTSFRTIPDAPVSRFVLNLQGGKKGLLINSRNLCRARHFARVRMTGQNGMRSNGRTGLQMACDARGSRQHKRQLYHGGKAVR
jgi:hypothetical protein